MIRGRTAARLPVLAVAALALSSALLFACSVDDSLGSDQSGSGDGEKTQQLLNSVGLTDDDPASGDAGTGMATVNGGGETAGNESTNARSNATGSNQDQDGDSTDASSHPDEAGQGDDEVMTVAELQELERALDEIDQLLTDLELDLEAD